MRVVIAAIFFMFIACPMTLAGLFLLSTNTWLTDREFYSDILNNPDLYEGDISTRLLATGIAGEITTPQQRQGPPDANADAAINALAQAIDAVTSADYPRDEITGTVDQIIAYLEGDQDALNVSISLEPLISALREPQGETTFAQIYAENLPVCVDDDEQYSVGLLLPDCRDSTMEMAETTQIVADNLPAFVNRMPTALETEVDIAFEDLIGSLQLATLWIVVFAVILLVLNAFIVGRDRRGFFMWLGLLLFIPAMMILLAGSGIQNGLADNNVEDLVVQINFEDITVTDEFRDALATTIVDALQDIAIGVLIVGGAATVIAALMVGIGFATPRSDRDDPYGGQYVNVPYQDKQY